ncbi:MAG: ACP S-malonyltransferase [Myxococcota bacterium]
MPAVLQFPGQTSFAPSLVREAAAVWPETTREVLDDASRALGRDLRPWLEQVDLRSNADLQVAVLLTNHVHLRAVEPVVGPRVPSLGHSLGELNHLVHIGALAFEDAVRLVSARGAAYDGGPVGVMIAVFPLDRRALEPIVASEPEAWIAAVNGPSQHVVAGGTEAVRRVASAVEAETFATVVEIESRLPMHCPRFAGVAEAFRPALREVPWREPHSPWISNVTGGPVEDATPDRFVELLTRHVCEPVQWSRCIDAVADAHRPVTFVEVGHGRGLSGLLRRSWRPEPRVWTSDFAAMEGLDAAR